MCICMLTVFCNYQYHGQLTLSVADSKEGGGVDVLQFQLPIYGGHPFMQTSLVNPSPKVCRAIHVMNFNTFPVLLWLTITARHVENSQHTVISVIAITQSSIWKHQLPHSRGQIFNELYGHSPSHAPEGVIGRDIDRHIMPSQEYHTAKYTVHFCPLQHQQRYYNFSWPFIITVVIPLDYM